MNFSDIKVADYSYSKKPMISGGIIVHVLKDAVTEKFYKEVKANGGMRGTFVFTFEETVSRYFDQPYLSGALHYWKLDD